MGTEATNLHPKPLVVLASRETGELRDIETALFSAGYRVVTARNEHETLQGVRNDAHSNYGTDYFRMDGAPPDGLLLTGKNTDYLGVPVEGPYKPEHYRY